MGKKKRGHPDIEEILARPWCYYCERDFDDLKILINHQRAKHFMCERCGRKLNTAGGLSVHMNQVHKETLTQIENALPNRANLDVEIFGMEGIPDDVVQAHNQRVLTQFAQADADRRAASGNPAPGGAGANGPKKPKLETPSEMKKRLAEHKAKKAAEEAAAAANPTPMPPTADVNGSQNPGYNQAPAPNFPGGPSPYPPQQLPYGAPAGNPMYGNSPQPFGQPTPQFAQQQPPPFQPQPQVFNSSPVPPPYGQQAFSPPQQYPQPGFQPPPFQHSPQPQFPGGPPRPYGANTPPAPHNVQSPSQSIQLPQRQNSLPNAPGLPQRPSFNAPNVNAMQMQQLHQGQLHNHSPPNVPSGASPIPTASPSQNGAGQVQPPSSITEAKKPEEAPKEKKSKKDKDKDIKLVYSDNEISPEEKMAMLSRYAFDPKKHEETVLGDIEGAVTNPAREYEDVPMAANAS